jgi:hypothetical protein
MLLLRSSNFSLGISMYNKTLQSQQANTTQHNTIIQPSCNAHHSLTLSKIVRRQQHLPEPIFSVCQIVLGVGAQM